MAVIGCKGCGSTEPPLKHIKTCLPAQEIALFFHSSTWTLMACQKKFFFEKKGKGASLGGDLFFREHNVLEQYKVPLHALDHSIFFP